MWIALGICVLPWRGISGAHAAREITAFALAIAAASMLAMPSPCFQESRYTCIRLYDRPLADGGLLRFMILDEGVHSASDRDHPQRLHLGYAALADRLAQAAFARAATPRALIVGGGGATLPRAWAATPRNAEVLSIELDPMVAAVANDRMWAGRQARLTTIVGDGRAAVRALPPDSAFDVVLMDAYRTRSVPPHLVTREFDRLIASRLTPRGVFLSNVIDRPDAPLLALSIARTLSEIFPAVDLWAAGDAAEGMTNYIVAAWKGGSSAHRSDREIVAVSVMNAGEAVRSQDVVWRRIDIKAADRQWPESCGIVLTDDRAPVDSLLAGRAGCRR
jgi:spermidine synthase